MGRYRTSFAYDHTTDEQLESEFRAALAQLDLLTNGDALRLRHSARVLVTGLFGGVGQCIDLLRELATGCQ